MKKISTFIFMLLAGVSANGAPFVSSPRAPQNKIGVTAVRATETGVTATGVNASSSTGESGESAATAADDGTQAAVDEIIARYNPARQRAADTCPLISGGLDKIKTFAGISTGASAGGTVAGGAAAVTGFMKAGNDETISAKSQNIAGYYGYSEYIDTVKKVSEFSKKTPEEKGAAIGKGEMLNIANNLNKQAVPQSDIDTMNREMDSMKNDSKFYGDIRTGGSFVAGGTGAVSAATSFIGVGQFDDVIKNMNSCTSAVQEIDRIRTELQFADSTNAAISEMTKIVDSCSGMKSNNISNIKGKLMATGVISSVGGVLGIVGGITSLIAGNREEQEPGALGGLSVKDGGTSELNTASNYLAAGASAASLASMIFGAVAVDGLVKNGAIVDKCKGAF
ncbi:MAG: hypothetical protein LBT45_02055 [Rickettsiales bacterium]|jgi:hypothetical protein|nr:hypothetical protein [Rickettsiales bacterium]